MRNRLKQGNFLGCICISILLAGCMSMPKPPDKSIEDANSLQKQMALQLTSKDMNGAMTSLAELRMKYTDDGKLSNGRGYYFRNEAEVVAYLGHLEFERNNVADAATRWKESFEIEYNGINAHQVIDQKNSKIRDDVINALNEGFASSKATAMAKSSKSSSTVYYSYPIVDTVLPTPEMMRTGIPNKTVLRFPIRVERPPFSNIVKFKGQNNFCTAAMVSPTIAVTAAHCMSQNGVAIAPDAMSIQRQGIFPSKSFKVSRYYTHRGLNAGWDTQRVNDWLILVTDAPYDFFTVYSQVLRNIPPGIASGKDKLMLAGYSSDLNQGSYLTLHYGCQAKAGQNLKGGMYFTNCENAKGSSGAPLMLATAPYYIVGIHTADIVSPTDEFYSVETFSDVFINTLASLSSSSVVDSLTFTAPGNPMKREISLADSTKTTDGNMWTLSVDKVTKAGKYIPLGIIAVNGANADFFIDASSIAISLNLLNVNVIKNFPIPQIIRNSTYKSEVNKIEMDCTKRGYVIRDQRRYSESNGTGNVVDLDDFIMDRSAQWTTVVKNSQMDKIMNATCGLVVKR